MGLISRVSSRTYRPENGCKPGTGASPKNFTRTTGQAISRCTSSAVETKILQQQKEQQKQLRQQQMQQKYQQLLKTIDELGKDIRPTYAGSRGAPERLKKGIVTAKNLVRECLIETERAARAQD